MVIIVLHARALAQESPFMTPDHRLAEHRGVLRQRTD